MEMKEMGDLSAGLNNSCIGTNNNVRYKLNKMRLSILTILLLVCALGQSQLGSTLEPLIVDDPTLLKTLNNYFGCKTWAGEVCLECSTRYYFNKNGICCEVKPECR